MTANPKRDIPLSIVTIVFIETVCYPQVYNVEALKIGHLLNLIGLTVLLTIMSMLPTYVAEIRGKIGSLMFENLNLLDGMHEGLLVLSTEGSKSL